jgi:y4mF family transcriptional regulator
MNNSELNQFVKDKRKSLGLTQEELSFKAGVGLRFIRELERGKPTLQMDKVNQVLKLFGFELGAVELNRNKLINEAS